MNDLLVSMIQTLDAPQHRFAELDRYYHGTQPLAFISPEARKALADRLSRMNSNLCRLTISAIAERLRIGGFSADIWDEWLLNDLDLLSGVAHREALTLGAAYICVWGRGNTPLVSVESARQVAVHADPGTRQITSAVKRWRTDTTTEAVLFLPDSVVKLRADSPGASTAGFYVVEEIPNPLGVVPVVQLRNADRLAVGGAEYPHRILEHGHSELDDLAPLIDGLSKILTDMMVTAEMYGRPQRAVSGLALEERPVLDDQGNPVVVDGEPVIETTNPLGDSTLRTWISENAETTYVSLPPGDLGAYESAVRVLLSQIQACSSLPSAYLGILTNQPPSADALRASSASLVAKAEERQRIFGRAWEQVARLMIAVRDGVDPNSVDVQVDWAPADYRSQAEEADSAVKLFAAGILSRETTLKRLGFSADEIAAEVAMKNGDLSAESGLQQYLTSLKKSK